MDPEPSGSEVVIEVSASGVCHHDVLARGGAFSRTRYPAILGHEIAGRVIKIGPDVVRLSAGDRVITTTNWNCGSCEDCVSGQEQLCQFARGVFGETVNGGYAERVLSPEHATIRIPDGVTDAEAAVTPCALGTAFHAIDRLRLDAGTPVVITGAGGGVGLHAVMLAAAASLQVIAITSSPEKQQALRLAGADYVIVSGKDNCFAHSVREIVREGVRVVLDPTCVALGEALRCLRRQGQVVILGNVGGGQVSLEPALLILKELGIQASRGASRSDIERLLIMIANGHIAPNVIAAGKPELIPELHNQIKHRSVAGKVVVLW